MWDSHCGREEFGDPKWWLRSAINCARARFENEVEAAVYFTREQFFFSITERDIKIHTYICAIIINDVLCRESYGEMDLNDYLAPRSNGP